MAMLFPGLLVLYLTQGPLHVKVLVGLCPTMLLSMVSVCDVFFHVVASPLCCVVSYYSMKVTWTLYSILTQG